MRLLCGSASQKAEVSACLCVLYTTEVYTQLFMHEYCTQAQQRATIIAVYVKHMYIHNIYVYSVLKLLS
jgi:hypothetical protein